jgi:hypothetical protein
LFSYLVDIVILLYKYFGVLAEEMLSFLERSFVADNEEDG